MEKCGSHTEIVNIIRALDTVSSLRYRHSESSPYFLRVLRCRCATLNGWHILPESTCLFQEGDWWSCEGSLDLSLDTSGQRNLYFKVVLFACKYVTCVCISVCVWRTTTLPTLAPANYRPQPSLAVRAEKRHSSTARRCFRTRRT